jgi:transposase
MKEISRDQRNCIISLLRDGKSLCLVAQKVDVGKSTIKRFGKEDCGDYKVSKGSRPRLIQGADERYVVRKITKDSTKSAKEVSKTLIGDAGIRISAQIVQRTLH